MSRFLKIEGESTWINVERVDGVTVRPQLRALGNAHGEGSLEELHEQTGWYEVVVFFQGQLMPVMTLPSKQKAEATVEKLLGEQLIHGL